MWKRANVSSGCSNSTVPADGLLNVPNFAVGCVCNYPIQTSFAMVHMPEAHSDGDAIVHFRDADVIHTGDIFFNVHYPFIDVDYGGNLEGMVNALDEILAHARPTALFIPGHGPLADRSDLESYTSMLRTVAQRVRAMVDEGRTREEVIGARPTAEFDEAWGATGGFAVPDFWVGLVYDGMAY